MNKASLDKILIFIPKYKKVLWGGQRISQLKGEHIDGDNIGESWEISAVPDHETIIASGSQKGHTLSSLIAEYGDELLGHRVIEQYGRQFPLLIKILDANQMLSLQVHPDDSMAAARHNSLGKTELWYIIDAAKDAKIYCGFNEALTPESFSRHIADKTIMDIVKSHDSEPGQFYFLPPGTIHSLGAGNLIAEIQESSDITYRVYDHDRRDVDGNFRELHTEDARAAIDYSFPSDNAPTAQKFAHSTQGVVCCPHFKVDYYDLSGESTEIKGDGGSFTIIMSVKGDITIEADGASHTLSAGHTALIPAAVKAIKISGKGQALTATV